MSDSERVDWEDIYFDTSVDCLNSTAVRMDDTLDNCYQIAERLQQFPFPDNVEPSASILFAKIILFARYHQQVGELREELIPLALLNVRDPVQRNSLPTRWDCYWDLHFNDGRSPSWSEIHDDPYTQLHLKVRDFHLINCRELELMEDEIWSIMRVMNFAMQ